MNIKSVLSISLVFVSWCAYGQSDWSFDHDFVAGRELEIQRLKDYAFDPTVESRQTTAALVIRRGKIVFEEYGPNHNLHSRHLTWSVSKSIVNALVGIAVKEGRLGLSDSICQYGINKHCQITIDDLLKWSSGLDWHETYENQSLDKSDVLNMLYRQRGHGDMAGFTLDRPLVSAPGEKWNYSSGDSNVLMAILKNIYGKAYNNLPWEKLFDPQGMTSAVWEQDQKGVFVGSSYAYMTARDLARFGYLFAHDGVYNQTRILPEGWVEYSAKPSAAMEKRGDLWQLGGVGAAHWWSNEPLVEKQIPAPIPSVPEDGLAARGHWGQFLFVIPSQDVLVVRFGITRSEIDEATGAESFNPRKFMDLVMDLVRD